jgi:hypothetical protein
VKAQIRGTGAADQTGMRGGFSRAQRHRESRSCRCCVVLLGRIRQEYANDSLSSLSFSSLRRAILHVLEDTQNAPWASRWLCIALFARCSLAIQAFSLILFPSGALQAPIARYRNVELPCVGVLSSHEACLRHGAVDSVQESICVLVHLAW